MLGYCGDCASVSPPEQVLAVDCPFKSLKIPQITGPWRSIALIILMVPIGGVANKALNGEIRTLTDIGTTLSHGVIVALGTAAGWIFFRSPWAPELQSLLYQQTQQKTTTTPAGAVTTQKTETTITQTEGTPEVKGH